MPWRMALWEYALALYGHPRVAEACLRLQDDFGADVCEILWECWLAYHDLGVGREAPTALAPIRRWQQETTRPLRDLRRRLKPVATAPETSTTTLVELRETLKRAELMSERETLWRLQHLAERGQGIRLLEPGGPLLSRRLLSRLPGVDKGALGALTILDAHLDPGASG